MKAIIKGRGVMFQDNKIFMCKLKKGGFFCLPGGTMEAMENTRECLDREIVEELGVKAEIGKLIHTHEFFTEKQETMIDFWYEINNPEDFLDVDLSKTTHGFELSECGFYDLDDIAGEYRPLDLKAVLECL